MASVNGRQDPYLATLDISTSEHLKLYNKLFLGIPENARYALTRYKFTEFYQEMVDAVSKFVFKSALHIITAIEIST